MKKTIITFNFAFALLLAMFALEGYSQDTPRQLKQTIASSIKALEAGNHREASKYLFGLASAQDINQGAALLKQGEVSGPILASLKHCLTVKPIISSQGSVATYELKNFSFDGKKVDSHRVVFKMNNNKAWAILL